MKKTIYSVLLYIFIFAFSMSFFDGITLPMEPVYWIGTAVIFALVVLLHKPVLRFLTIKVNFVTFWLTAAILSVGAFYALELVVPGLEITASAFKGVSTGSIIIQAFDLSKISTMIVASTLYAGLCAMMESLKGGGED